MYGYAFSIFDYPSTTSNHNLFYADSGSFLFLRNFSDDYYNLASWTDATGLDSSSIAGDPNFVSTTNLHIDTSVYSPANNNAIPVVGITDDYDGNMRNVSTPDIGADEFIGIPGTISLNLTMFIEGFYDATSNTQVSDTVKTYLRNSSSSYVIVDSAKSVVSASGSAAFTFSNASTGNYFIVVTHRNSIETWSASAVSMAQESAVNYNFSGAANLAYGDNIKQINTSPVKFGIFSGDVNLDETIDVGDIVDTYNDALAGLSGYVKTDVNGDDFVDVTDIVIVYNNSINIVTVIRP